MVLKLAQGGVFTGGPQTDLEQYDRDTSPNTPAGQSNNFLWGVRIILVFFILVFFRATLLQDP
jgi:hypothetical protein